MHTAARLLMRWRLAASALLVALLVAPAWQLGANADVPKFGETLPLAIKFFEAQMSGEVPAWSYATQTHEWAEHGAWRSNSHLQDGQPSYELKGGWYAGHIKNTQTIAASASVLAFAGLTWETTFKGEGLYLELLRNVDWAAQYIEKCSVTGNKFVAQVGDHFTEEAYWGGPERAPYSLVKYSSGWRPVYTIDLEAKCDGADVLSEAVAALAGAGLLHLKASSPDTARGNALIEKAKQLWAVTKDINAV
ncbi:hypothetical protein GPECTOR_31g292 [Gonium pectorale]|uniref:cellulase n=1 Tax=Gonium pectorale TaxID=33097 RepID=A0A150GF14_GONPE|nr:hypothetical protein GPECTOR_31g292 [Gonium pectorale]|eukprot:KXZ47930.1 hypothetical protein GPECTOR_31g292 [Gonium pectorale]